MKVLNPVASGKASGRALGGVFSFNRGMGTFKKYVKPYPKNTAKQQVIKTRFAYLTKFWRTELTYEEITLWNDWALPWTDIYGDAVSLTGINKFVICNDTLLRAEKTLTRIPPTETPSELTVENTTHDDLLVVEVDGITNVEIAAQESFLQIQILGTLQDISYITGILSINALGISVSRRPLEKLYNAVYFYDCRIDLDEQVELTSLLKKDGKAPSLQSLRIQRFNKFGYWSAPLTYTDAVITQNLAINGHLYFDASWSKGGGCTIHDGEAYFTETGSLEQTISAVVQGTEYQIDFDIVETEGTGYCFVWLGSHKSGGFENTGHYSYDLTPGTSNQVLKFEMLANWIGHLDNIIIKKK